MIDLKEVNWTMMTPQQCDDMRKKIADEQKIIKNRKKRDNENVSVRIDGQPYFIKAVEYNKLKSLRSQKSLDKFKQQLKEKYTPIIDTI